MLKLTGPWVLRLERNRYSRLVSLEMELGIGPIKLLLSRSNSPSLDGEEIFPKSRVPLSWFSCKRTNIKEGSVKREEGMVPVKAL